MAEGRAKGNGFENEACRALSRWLGPVKPDAYFYDDCLISSLPFRRRSTSVTPSSGSWEGSGDILHVKGSGIVFPFRVEAKCWEGWELDGLMQRSRVDPWEWWEQAKGQSDEGYFPLMVFTRNHRPVYAMLETKVAQCLKLQPNGGPCMAITRPLSVEQVTVCLLADLVRTSRKLVAQLAGASVRAKRAS